MVGESMGPECFPVRPSTFSIGEMFPDFVGLVQEASGDCVLGAHMEYSFWEIGTWASAITLRIFFYFDVYSQ